MSKIKKKKFLAFYKFRALEMFRKMLSEKHKKYINFKVCDYSIL